MLDRVDAAGDERAAVAEAFDDEDRRRLGLPRPQEVTVQGMHLEPRIDRTDRRHQRLAGDVAAESALQEPDSGLKTPPR